MAHTILSAVDESEEAGRVLNTAHWLADASHGSLVVVHAIQGLGSDADELVGSVRTRLADDLADVRLLGGSPANAILEAADRERAGATMAQTSFRTAPRILNAPATSLPRAGSRDGKIASCDPVRLQALTSEPHTAERWCRRLGDPGGGRGSV